MHTKYREDTVFMNKIFNESYGVNEDEEEAEYDYYTSFRLWHYPKIISYCIMQGYSKRYKGAFHMAFTVGDLDLIKYLIYNGCVDPSLCNDSAITVASSCGHTNIVNYLLRDKRVDPSKRDNKAVMSASENGYLEIVKLLLADKRVDPSAQNNIAIAYAARNP